MLAPEGVNAHGGNIQLPARGALVQRLDVLQNMLESEPVRGNQVLRQRVKHEGIVRVGRMAQSQSRLLYHRE